MVDLILNNGRIWTATGTQAQALAVHDGRIAAVGTDDEIGEMAGPSTRVIDLQGRRVLPGLVDSHIHIVRGGVSWDVSLHFEDVTTLAEALDRVRARAAEVPAGTWISVIGGWHARQLAEGRGPTRAELDEAAPDHPVYLQQLYDRGMLNTAGLAACGFADDSPDPERGSLARDADGALTGEIFGTGAYAVPIGLALRADHDVQVSGTRRMMQEFAAHGLTGANDGGGMLIVPADYRAMFDVWRAGEMALRVRVFYSAWTRGGELADIDAVTAIQGQDFGDDMLKVIGVGEIPVMGCHDLEGLTPFEITDEHFDNLADVLGRCLARGWRVSMHAVRDATLARMLDVWEALDGESGRLGELHWSIVHADEASDATLDRIAALGVGIQIQNRMPLKARDYLDVWGADAPIERMPPLGAMRARGIRFAGGTDATRANRYLPWPSIEWLVTGENLDGAPARAPEHRLSVEDALLSYTRDTAWFSGEEDHRGMLAVGFDADLCVPTEDPFAVEPERLGQIRSDLTMVGGRLTHVSGDFAEVVQG